MPKQSTIIYSEDTSKRLDLFLSDKFREISRSQINKAISSGQIQLNSVKCLKSGTKLRQGDRLTFDPTLFLPSKTPKIKLPIIYEDKNVIVINKPSGVITHSKGRFNFEASVASFISDKIDPALLTSTTDSVNNRAGIVHRLDRGTSGIILVVKNEATRLKISRQFSKHKVSKVYYAIIEGKLSKDEAVINMPIERNPKHPSTFRVGSQGKAAATRYLVVKTSSDAKYSLLKLMPITGRTHQIRVHLRAINHPIVGDNTYGGEPAARLMLHAAVLELNLEAIGKKSFKAPLPSEFNEYVDCSDVKI